MNRNGSDPRVEVVRKKLGGVRQYVTVVHDSIADPEAGERLLRYPVALLRDVEAALSSCRQSEDTSKECDAIEQMLDRADAEIARIDRLAIEYGPRLTRVA